MRVLAPDSTVLLTGCTGLIGGEILKALLEGGAQSIWALARPRGSSRAEARVLERLHRSRFVQPKTAERSLRAIEGDVTEPFFGLNAATASELAAKVDIVIHCASCTSFVRHSECLRANVAGAERVARFVASCRRPPLIVYFSTSYNCGAKQASVVAEPEGGDARTRHLNGYTLSKAIAEERFATSGLDCLVLRPSVVLSRAIPDRRFARSLLWCVPIIEELGCAPMNAASRVDIVPVDFVVKAALRLLARPARRHRCYHLTAGPGSAVTCGEMLDAAARHYGRFIELSSAAWEAARSGSPRAERLASAVDHYAPFLGLDVVFDNRRLRSELGDDFPPLPRATEYLGDLLRLLTLEEAVRESSEP